MARCARAARGSSTVRGGLGGLLTQVWTGAASDAAVAEATELSRRSGPVIAAMPHTAEAVRRYAAALDRATSAMAALQRTWDATGEQHEWAVATVRLRSGGGPETAALVDRLDEEHARAQAALRRKHDDVVAELRSAMSVAARAVESGLDAAVPRLEDRPAGDVRRAVTGGLPIAEGAIAAAEARRVALADSTALRALATRGPGTLPAEAVIGAVASRALDPLYAQEVVGELGVSGLHQLVADLSARGAGSDPETVQMLTALAGSLVVTATAAPTPGVDPRTRRQLASSAALVSDEVVAFAGGQIVASTGRDRHAGYWLLGQALTGARLAGDARPLPRPLLARLVTATIDAEVAETRDADGERRNGTTSRPGGGDFFSSFFDEADTTGDALHTLLVELGDDPATQRAVLAAPTGQDTIRGTRGEALSVAEYLVRRWITYEANGVATTEGLSLATDADLAHLMRSAACDGSAESAQLRSRVMAEIGRTSAWSRGEVSTVRLYESTTSAIEDAAVEWVTQMPQSVTHTIMVPSLVTPDVRSMWAAHGHEPVLTLEELTGVVGAFAVATDFSSGGKPPAARHRRLVEAELASAGLAAGARRDVDAAIVRLAFYEGAGSAALMGEAARQDAFSRRSLEELSEAKNLLFTLLRRPRQVALLTQSLLTSGSTRTAEDDFVVSLLRSDISSAQAEANERRVAATAAEALLLTTPAAGASVSVDALWAAGSSAAPAGSSSEELRATRRAEILAAADALVAERSGENLSRLLRGLTGRPGTQVPDRHEIAEGRDGPLLEFEALPRGDNRGVRLVRTEEDILELHARLTQHAAIDLDACYDKVFWMERPDGIRVGLRIDSRSGGATIDLKFPDGTERRVHVSEPRHG